MATISNLWPIQQDKAIVITNIINDPALTDTVTRIEGKGFGSAAGTVELLTKVGETYSLFLDITSNITYWSDTELAFTTNLDMLGVTYVRVTNTTLNVATDPFKLIVNISSKYKPMIFEITPAIHGILPFTLEIKGENLLPINKVFIGDQQVTVKNVWCTNTNAAGHALAPVTVLAVIPDNVVTGIVRVDCEFGIAVGPVLKIEAPSITAVSPASFKWLPSQNTPYTFIVDGKWFANSNTEWTFNGNRVTVTAGSVKNRVALSVAPGFVIPNYDNIISYKHGNQTASITVRCNPAEVTEVLVPTLHHVPEASYNETIDIKGQFTKVYGCSLFFDETLIAPTSWDESMTAEGMDTISVHINSNIMPGWVQLRWEQEGIQQFSNIKELKFKTPKITAISTDTGVGGDVIVLTTENAYDRKNKSAVMMGNTACPIVSWTNESVTFKIPLDAATGNVYLDTPYGRSNSYKLTVESTYLITPRITDISPKTGTLPLEVAINGEYFSSNTGEAFLGDVRLTVTKWTDKQVVVIIPSGSTTANVRLKNRDWELSGPVFTVPEVTAADTTYRKYAFNPYIANTDSQMYFSGDTITLKGVNFKKGMTAQLDYNDPVELTYISNTEATFVLPDTATSGYLKVLTSEGLSSNSKLIKIKPGLPSITSFMPKKPTVGKYLTILGSNFGTKSALATFKVRFGPGPYSTVPDSDIKLWSDTEIKIFLSPTLEYSTGNLQVISEGYSSNAVAISVEGNTDAPTSNMSLAYISQGHGLKSNSGIQFTSITQLQPGCPKVVNLDAALWDGKSWNDIKAFIEDTISGANRAAITISGVKPDLLGNIILRGINGIVVLGNQTESGMQILIKPLEMETLMVSLDNSTIATSFCDSFGVCRGSSKTSQASSDNSSKQIVSQVIKGPGIKITRYTSTGELYVNGMNISKERLVISPDFGLNSDQVLPGNHTHGDAAIARFSVSSPETSFYESPENRDVIVFGTSSIAYNAPAPVTESINPDGPAIYMTYPKKAPAGCTVGVIGHNFTPDCKINIGGVDLDTEFVTANELRFVVPEVLLRSNLAVNLDGVLSNKVTFIQSKVWTDPAIVSKTTPIKALHLKEIRDRLIQKLSAFGLVLPTRAEAVSGGYIAGMDFYALRHAINRYQFEQTIWTDEQLTSQTYVQAIHILELRWAVNDLIFDPVYSIAVDSGWNNLRQKCDAIYRDFVYNYPSIPGYEAFLDSIKDGYVAE